MALQPVPEATGRATRTPLRAPAVLLLPAMSPAPATLPAALPAMFPVVVAGVELDTLPPAEAAVTNKVKTRLDQGTQGTLSDLELSGP
jgi:hypothetical protein